jgi:hypothetical protein
MTPIRAYCNFYLIVAFLLFYSQFFLSPLQIDPKIRYAIIFLLYTIVVVFDKNSILKMNKWLFYAVVVLIPSFLVGLGMGWSYVDIAADLTRYLAPFLGYVAGLLLLKQLDYDKTLYLIYGLLALHLIRYYYSIITKIDYVAQGGDLVEYAADGLEVHHLFFFIVFFLLRKNLVGGVKKILLYGYVVGFTLNPIFLMSKARFITMLLSFALIFIFYSKAKDRIFIIAFALFMAGTSSLFINNSAFDRFKDTIELIETREYSTDPSTSVRVAEIANITFMMHDKSPYSLPFGFGSGALYYDDFFKYEGGLEEGNFRSDGGIHDVFTMPFGYLFRYGLIGFFLIYYFTFFSYKRILVYNDRTHQDTISKSIKLFVLVSAIADLFVPVHMYGNFHFGFIIAIGVVLQSKFKTLNNSLK